ncbi:helix-turn-helix domain-containing protein [Lacticaseibacillus baoqingensis]|uniref:Helix-turn-helix domain-containing protein n=1 Tax=Lacticaseibacillus baoqingensis TaxID=2486013 RepID=A0ABW4EBY2_9LACO|nr:helix-turn-helix domain-containing protein [Lacticaseibacillus baoqingensis]
MLDDLLIQFFDLQPRRPTAVYLLLTGKKTLSILFAAMQHHQLQWLQLYPTLARADFQAAIARLQAAQALQEQGPGLVLEDAALQAAAKKRLPLPTAYRPEFGVASFAARFYLAVQVLSEASFGQKAYRPLTNDWATQQAVRTWWASITPQAAIKELTAAFAQLPPAQATLLTQAMVGHDFVGPGQLDSLQAQMAQLDALSALISTIAAHPKWPALNRLWGGKQRLGSQTMAQALALSQAGLSKEQIAQRLRLKSSTVNEHLLTAALFGAELPVASFYSPAQFQQLTTLVPQAQHPYQELLVQVADSDFFQIRLFQILCLTGRWPDGGA